jgi:glutamate transport system substrate-binding protein
MRVRHFGVAAAALAVATMGISGCSAKKASSIVDKAKNDKKLTIGVKFDQPGLGQRQSDGSVKGFDVDVATYIAKKLGVDAKNITWKEARSANRDSFAQNGTVDMVIATYSITADRMKKVTFGGPYYVAHQDVMVRGNDNSIKSLADIKGKKICAVQGSVSWKNITDGTNLQKQKVDAKTVPANGYDDCITKLKGGSVDVVSTDNAILAGFAAREGSSVKLVNVPFTDEKYGVGIKKGDTKSCEAINKAIASMYQDGSAKQYLQAEFGQTSLKFDTTLPQPVGCS